MVQRCDWRKLTAVAADLLRSHGLSKERAQVVATVLVEADLMGHTTHGLRLLPSYLDELASGRMKARGDHRVLEDNGGAFVWDGYYLPGPWLVTQAIETAAARVGEYPVVCGAVRRSHHIASLSSYLLSPTERGLVCFIATSDPSVQTVAPFGGRQALYTPNPIAFGIPTDGDPLLIDMSTSATANGVVSLYRSQGRRLPGSWLLDDHGIPTDDPEALFGQPPGSILPLGGSDLGYKGYALGLVVEVLTCGLAGHGRADEITQWGASFFVCILDPASFGGADAFLRQVSWLVSACRQNPVRDGFDTVRLPGDLELSRREDQKSRGVQLDDQIFEELCARAHQQRIDVPGDLAEGRVPE